MVSVHTLSFNLIAATKIKTLICTKKAFVLLKYFFHLWLIFDCSAALNGTSKNNS